MEAYLELERRFRRLCLLDETAGVLGWDHAVIMPDGGAGARAEQRAELALIRHEILGDAGMAELLDRAEAAAERLDPWQAANLRQMRRRWQHATAVPAELVEALSKASAASNMAWRKAREAGDFKAQMPHLERVRRLVREVAEAKGAAFDLEPYDALMDSYEAGLRRAEVEPLFAELESFLPDFLEDVLVRQDAAGPPLRLDGPFPKPVQKALGERLMRDLGFDFAHGRLDESHHPFSGGVKEDVRITTRYDEDDFNASLMAVLHETGHALYSRNLPDAWRYQPVGDAMGMVVHESQSLIVEMLACRSDAFMTYLSPVLQDAFGVSGPAWAPENLARHQRKVTRGLIRVDADEVTYPLHVILRYRLERALLSGDLAVADLPGAWNDAMQQLIGVRPPDDRDGCLQDVHWFGGSFGYFPTYTLGALAAAQLYQTAGEAVNLPASIAEGDFRPLLDWLRDHVHSQGRLLSDHNALLRQATGRPLAVDAFRRHLETRYGA